MKIKSLLSFKDPVNFATISPDGNLVASCGDCFQISISDLRSEKLVESLLGHEDFGFSLSWHPNQYYLASGN